MSLETDLRAYLLAQTPITALVGQRIHPGAREQGDALPAITYQRISTTRGHYLTGGAGHAMPRIQFDCLALTYIEAKSVADALRGELQGFSGTMGSTTVGSVVSEDERSDYSPPVHADEEGVYRQSLDYFLLHNETIPTF